MPKLAKALVLGLVAALALTPDGKLLLAQVATGSEGEKGEQRHWRAVRLLDVEAAE
jgi:hypothetical protein